MDMTPALSVYFNQRRNTRGLTCRDRSSCVCNERFSKALFRAREWFRKHMDQTARNDIAIAFGSIAIEAGRAIMAVRGSGDGLQYKSDGSPVTKADIDADRIICARL